LIGWRTADFLNETTDIKSARNWEVHYEVLPIFEGDPNTKLVTTPQPKQEQGEPVAWMVWGHDNVPSLTFTKPADKYVFDSLYMIPPQRTWVGLTDEEIEKGCKESWVTEQAWQSAVWWAEAKLKDKNGY
jgi:hypothetical protein